MSITDEMREEAERYLNFLIAEYAALGKSGYLSLNIILLPLKKRLDNFGMDKELYDEIMSLE